MADNVTSRGWAGADSRLAAGRRHLVATLLDQGRGEEAARGFEGAWSGLLDDYFRGRLAEMDHDPDGGEGFALLAVGGYGRSEVSLHSDVDVLVVSSRGIPARAIDLAQPLFTPLWDMGLDLGHGFRTIRDCLDLSAKDFQVLASFLDMRLVAGDREVMAELRDRLEKRVFHKRRDKFLDWLRDRYEVRLRTHGDGSGLLEPNLKEGVGGLRDYHKVLWRSRLTYGYGSLADLVRAGRLSMEEYGLARGHLDFVFRARNLLHHLSGRRNDRLHLDLQPQVAGRMGFADSGEALAVERFLGRLHGAMAGIKAMGERFVPSGEGARTLVALPATRQSVAPGVDLGPEGLAPADARALDRDPLALMRLFERSACLGVPLSWEALRTVSSRLDLAGGLAQSPGAWTLFQDVLLTGRAYPALEQMLQTGFLGAWIPELGRVQDRVQFDAFHTYPVGLHSLVAVRWLEDLARERRPVFSRLWEELEPKLVLLLAALFHDVGKAGPGAERHEETGVDLAARALARWSLDQAVIREVGFLVRHHLLLVRTATRRDLADESVVADCASRIGSRERLDMLYLLAYADARATGPKAWNDWTARLLSELYFKVLHLLAEGWLAEPHLAQKLLRKRDRLRVLAGGSMASVQVERLLDRLSPRYLLRAEPEAVLRHATLMDEMERARAEEEARTVGGGPPAGVVALEAAREQGDIWDLTLAARREPGLFAAVAGVLSLHGVNILSADVYTWGSDAALTLLKVDGLADPLYADELWGRVRQAIRYALAGKLSLEYRLDQKRSSLLAASTSGPGGTTVRVDNQASDFYTVVEVLSRDRIGLLYEIAHTLDQLRLQVHVARVSTQGGSVSDVFYVRGALGGKVEDAAQAREVERALVHRLDRV